MLNYFKFFLNQSFLINKIKKGAFIIAKVLEIRNKFLILDANLKSEIYMPINEFLNKQNKLEVSKGDYVEVLIESLDTEKGNVFLSRIKLREYICLKIINKYFKEGKIVRGILFKKIKGGFNVLIKDTKCFLPFSGIDKKILLNNSYYENKNLLFKIISFDKIKKNIILNRKFFIKKILDFKKKIFIKKFLKRGKLVKCVVKNINSYGVFVDLGYADGIILSKNISWISKKYSNEVIRLNQSLVVRVLEVDKIKNIIFLGLKQVINDPWNNISLKYKKGYIKYARVYKITSDTFYFVLEKGIYSSLKKIVINRFFDYKKNINNIKVNNYIKIIIKNIYLKNKSIDIQLV